MRPTAFFALAAVALGSPVALADDHLKPAFNGSDLAGWKTTGNWKVKEEGVIALEPRPGEEGWKRWSAYLLTEKSYDDFTISFDFKYEKGGNSGFFFNVADRDDPVEQGMEIQILDSYELDRDLTHHDMGGVIRTTPASKNMSKPPGEWNTMVVTCKGEHLSVTLNGEQIIDLQLDESKAKDKPKKGYLGFQDHGDPLWFRNVKISGGE